MAEPIRSPPLNIAALAGVSDSVITKDNFPHALIENLGSRALLTYPRSAAFDCARRK
jgi:hypothetical protein